MPDSYCSDPDVLALCARLRAAREALGINVAAAARAMRMSPTRLSALETGRTEPKGIDVGLISRLTGVSTDDLHYGDDPAAREPIPVPDTAAARRVPRGGVGRARSLQKRREARPRPPATARNQPAPKPAPKRTGTPWQPEAWRRGEAS